MHEQRNCCAAPRAIKACDLLLLRDGKQVLLLRCCRKQCKTRACPQYKAHEQIAPSCLRAPASVASGSHPCHLAACLILQSGPYARSSPSTAMVLHVHVTTVHAVPSRERCCPCCRQLSRHTTAPPLELLHPHLCMSQPAIAGPQANKAPLSVQS
jgi:hypothetical protein